jgi:predicted XRE-type DNA-binding protein
MHNKNAANARTRFVQGSGNVFADIGLSDPKEALAKAMLAEAVCETIKRRKLTHAEAATIMGVDQPKVSLIINGRLDGFTQDHLTRYFQALGDTI